ncbi:hypothetical protein [Nostoc sp. NMS4]|nr:hypothetical protein [Nostoc sp. NMS4]
MAERPPCPYGPTYQGLSHIKNTLDQTSGGVGKNPTSLQQI